MKSFINWTGGGRQGRGAGMMGILFLIALVVVIIVFRMLSTNENRQRQRGLIMAMEDPKTLIERYFLEASKDLPYKESGWEELLNFMSQDDLAWFNTNFTLLATTSQKMEGAVALAATERERRYGALDVLTAFTTHPTRPTIVQVQVNGDRGAVFVHNPGDVKSMRVIFVAKEAGSWKIRRFLGKRDDFDIMKFLVESHEWQQTPLTDDELAFKADPQFYSGRKHNEFMKEAGLTPDAQPPAASPTPEPNQP